jgi:hypothetical protein
MRPAWQTWLKDFERSLDALNPSEMDVSDFEDAEHRSVALAIFARLRAELRAALALADAGRDTAFRSQCRSAIECALHLFHGEVERQYLEKLRSDDTVSRPSRAKSFLKHNRSGIPATTAQNLDGFLRDTANVKGKLVVSDIESPFPRLNHVYREISADAAHVTWTSLHRQIDQTRPGWITISVDPKVDAHEIEEAASILVSLHSSRPGHSCRLYPNSTPATISKPISRPTDKSISRDACPQE